MNKIKTGLAIGYLLGLIHLIWAVLVALIPAQLQKCFDWLFNLHGLEPVWIITSMTWTKAITLVIVTFIIGYIIGWVFAYIYTMCHRTKTK